MDFVPINPGDKVAILPHSQEGAEQPTISYVESVLDNHHIIIYAPIYKTVMLSLPTDIPYFFHFYSKTGLCSCKGKILERFQQNNVALLKIEAEEFEYIQRRNAYRVPTGFAFAFTNIADGKERNGQQPVYSGTVHNISAGGMCFESSAALQKDDTIICRLALNALCANIEGRVLDSFLPVGNENSSGLSTYRIQFQNVEHRTQENLIDFVFQLQRELLLREKNRIVTSTPLWDS